MFGNEYNPYFMQPQMQRLQQMEQQYNQQYSRPQQPMYRPVGLQGKSVDSMDMVKAIEFPLDGTVSYFPLIDGTAIVTKQIMQDGTSKTTVYKPVDVKEPEAPKYATIDSITAMQEEINNLKKQIEDMKGE